MLAKALVHGRVAKLAQAAAEVDDVSENDKVVAMKPEMPVCQECAELRLGVP
jgi:hypothetical protein